LALGLFFGKEALTEVECPNRDLLFEFCQGNELMVASTFFRTTEEEKVTFFVPGAFPMGPISEDKYHLLDLIICDSCACDNIRRIRSRRDACLASNHYLVICSLTVGQMRTSKPNAKVAYDRKALNDKSTLERFTAAFCKSVEKHAGSESPNERWARTVEGMRVAENHLPAKRRGPINHGLAR